jgi:hypothetical protein
VKFNKKHIERFVVAADTGNTAKREIKDPIGKTPQPAGKAVEKIVAGYSVKPGALRRGGTILFQKTPVIETRGGEKAATEFSNKMAAFLRNYGRVRQLSKEGGYLYLSGAAVRNGDCRYLALPYAISASAAEKKTDVSSFVTLDKAGNFVPTAKGTTLKALERETVIRFLVVDLSNKTIVFDERVKDIDKGFKELDLKSAKESPNTVVKNSILIIEGTIETLLKKQFN